ncbi:MAG: hypothetical protein GY708_08785 [Actinomycetia bacterium]|nr:hypothetical protein [Actinomycetes bacterium]MCP4959957.1 hypothetical protein [Actinomycetes bacterium]
MIDPDGSQSEWSVVHSAPPDEEPEVLELAERLLELDLDVRVVRESSQPSVEPAGEDTSPEDTSASEPAELLHIIVPSEQSHEAAVEVGLFLAVSQSQAHAGRTDVFAELDVEPDDLLIAEITATGGPVYELDDFEDMEEVRALLRLFDASEVRWVLDREARLVVHYNDESKVDALIDRIYDEVVEDGHIGAAAIDRSVILDAEVYDAPPVPVLDSGLPAPSQRWGNGVESRSVADLDGRVIIDDLTSGNVPVKVTRMPWWLAVVAGILLVVVCLVFVV